MCGEEAGGRDVQRPLEAPVMASCPRCNRSHEGEGLCPLCVATNDLGQAARKFAVASIRERLEARAPALFRIGQELWQRFEAERTREEGSGRR